MVGAPITVTAAEPVTGVGGIGAGGMPGCENWLQAAAHVNTTAHKTRIATAPLQPDMGAQGNRARFLEAKTRVKKNRRARAKRPPGRYRKEVPGTCGGRK